MKKTFKILFLLSVTMLLVCLVFSLSACSLDAFLPQYNPTPDDGDETPDEGKDDDSNTNHDGDADKSKEYTITFVMGPSKITQKYQYGDTIVPPTFEPYETSNYYVVFDGWRDNSFATVTKDATYYANFLMEYKDYIATFVMGDTVIEVPTKATTEPEAPAEIPDYNGLKFLCWDQKITVSDKDITYTAVYFDDALISQKEFKKALSGELMKFSDTEGGDSGLGLLRRAVYMYTLALHEHEHPQGGIIASRVVEHLTSVVTKDQAPPIDASTNWAYNPMLAAIAFARVTPTIWNKVPADIQLRINTLMEGMIYLGSFSTSDYNSYATGVGMYGNYNKNWNPNYRLGNIPTMVYATYYFGNGDIELGAQMVNERLKAFNEDVYTKLVNNYQKFGWRRAFKRWTAEARTSTDGKNVKGESAKTLLCYGGQAVGEDTSTSSDLLVALGSGTGVANLDPKTKKGRDYLYKGFALTEPEQIVRSLINYNYSGGAVKSEHWYDVDKEKEGEELVAWILGGYTSPYEGMDGMMKEFASGNRSSTGYCTHDFVLTTVLLSAVRAMETYTTDENGQRVMKLDENGNPVVIFDFTTDEEFFHKVQIGNEDLIYKAKRGYQGYATGSYGVSSKVGYESTGGEYTITKSIWRTAFLPLGTVAPAESYIE